MKSNLLKSIFISLILLMGVNNAWAYVTYYLKSDNTTWDTGNNGWGFTHGTTTTTYMANGSNFKLWRTDWGNDGWFGVDNGKLKPGDGGLHFLQYKGDVQYNGPSGMVCFHMDQAGNNSDSKPWVWITRPTFYLKHNWSGGSWTWKALTDNQDGTYQLTDYYGGTTLNYGDNNDNNSNGWASVTASTTGTLSTGKKCIFTFNSADKTINITRLYTIKYNGNGSTTGVPSNHDKKHGTNTTLASSTPTRTGYTFAGWNTKADGSGTNYAKGATYSANADVTLYAQWTANQYTITYKDQNDATFSGTHDNGYPTKHIYDGGGTTLKNASKTGYTFEGWYKEAACTNIVTSLGATAYTANITLYAKWTANKYNVTLNPQSGTGGTTSVTATYDSAMPVITKPSRTGYTFGGYYTEKNGGGTQYYKADGSSAKNWDKTAATTLYAQWTAKDITINWNANGGSVTPTSSTYTYDGDAITLPTPSYAGHRFLGWFTAADGGTQITDVGTTNKPYTTVTYYAHWQGAPYTVELNQEGAAKKGSTTSVVANFEGNMPAITVDGALPTPPNGYAFMGYFDQRDGKGTQYYNADGTSANVWDKAKDATLYAYFKAAEITIGLNAASFEPNSATPVIATATLKPKPVGTTSICWELLYDDDTPVAEHDPTQTGDNQVQFNINDLATGTYQIKATLREGEGCKGTIISHATQVFTITSDHTITIKYVDENGQTIKASTTQSAHVSSLTEITASEIIGYTFKEWEAGDGVSIKDATDGKKNTATIEYNAYYDGYLKAIYTKNSNIIYFYNTLNWSSVYIYLYGSDGYWDNDKGAGATGDACKAKGAMTKIEGTDIWYYDLAGVNNFGNKLAFTEGNHSNHANFNGCQAVYRTDYNSAIPMFVPIKGQNPEQKNNTNYYNKGYWMNYPENTGYKLQIYDKVGDGAKEVASVRFPYSTNTIMPLTVSVDLEAGKTYGFKILREDNVYFGNDGTITGNITNWSFETGKNNCGLQTTLAGDYTFTLKYADYNNNKDYNYRVDVVYPVSVGDYRVIYKDKAQWSQTAAHGDNWYHPSYAIKKNSSATEEKTDIVSFFIAKDNIPTMKFQKCTAINGQTVTWTDNGTITIPTGVVTAAGVYNFIVKQPAGGASISVESVEPYTGNYYIRCNAVGGQWDNYKTNKENRMTYSAFSEKRETNSFGELFSHYVTKYCPHSTNIKFTVANDYSPCISDTLVLDYGANNTTNPFGNLENDGTLKKDGGNNDKYSANVRFMWNRNTNKISRAYIGRAVTNDFLVITGDKQLQKSDGKTLRDTIVFFDKQNWIYEVKMKVQPTTRVKVYAAYPAGVGESKAQYFCGAYNNDAFNDDEDSKLALGGSVDDKDYYSIRVLYDFKTNRLMAAWMPNNNEIDTERSIESDVMIIRDHQNAAQCITFANDDSKLTNVKTVYGVMRFNRWILNNRGGEDNLDIESCTKVVDNQTVYDHDITDKYHPVLDINKQKSQYERALYFISFPFDVHLSDIFGFGTYGQHWIIEYYDGLKRAREGYWIDSDPNWKYVTNPTDFVLKAYEGYILCLNLGKMAYDNTDFWAHNISQVELFFPSFTTMEEISKIEVTMPSLGEEYLCKINRGDGTEGDRRVKDSYWRCIGVPSYANYSNVLKDEKGDPIKWQTSYKTFPFLYKWNKTDNTLTPQSTTNFKFETMHAYLVQNGGEIHWSAVNATPDKPNAGIIAKVKETTRNYEWRITLTQGEKEHDQAFVRLSDNEQVTTEFDFNQDLSKEFNYGRSDIYTLIGYEKAAANSLPLSEQTTLIPLGLSIEYNGDYTIAMPDGTANIGVTLIDTESNTRTNLSAGMEYTLTLKKGDYNNRFFIEISPIQQTPTDIEYVENSHDDQARKVLIDNILYIVRDGQIFDARGARLK